MIGANTIGDIPLFAELERATIREMATGLSVVSWPAGQQILSPAETAAHFLVITSGRVKVVNSNNHDGRELTLWLLGRGDAINVVSLLDGEVHQVSAWTLDPAQALMAPLVTFREWMDRFPDLRRAMLRYAAQQLRQITDLASDLALHGTMTRLAQLLLDHVDQESTSRKVQRVGDLPHEEIAGLIGSVRVVVNRMLGQLRREGAVVIHEGAIHIANLKRLLSHVEHQSQARNQARNQVVDW